ncbi:hypothetical protein, partial [Enterococcus avium]|uniref:hypothetical protein n=1 Tax=Enterococcus avium TaxID=33945 RepID=UPI0028A08F07
GAQNAPHIGLSFIQICLHQHDLTKSLKKELPSRQSLLIWLKEKADQKVCCNVIYIRHMPDPT